MSLKRNQIDLAIHLLITYFNSFRDSGLRLTDEHIHNLALLEIEKLLKANCNNLAFFESMPMPDEAITDNATNQFIVDEMSYDIDAMRSEFNGLYPCLTDEQRKIYNKIMDAVDGGRGGVFLLYSYGGTGKTFIWRMLYSGLSARGDIVLPVASSGIASLLLPRGRSAHSRFGIPIKCHEDSTCNKLKPDYDVTGLLKQTKLIIWDEAPMTNKHFFEALDMSLRDVMKCPDDPFGGLVVVFGGDFRQILPVVPGGRRYDIVNAPLCSSRPWDSCEVLQLTKNMRLQSRSSAAEVGETQDFAEWILQVGDGVAGEPNDGEVDIKLPDDILIREVSHPIFTILDCTYPSLLDHLADPTLDPIAPTNEMVNEINDYVMSKMHGDYMEYLSADSISKTEAVDNELEELFSVEFLNTINCSVLPNHKIVLKLGCMIMHFEKYGSGFWVVQWNKAYSH